ncbi:MAG: hypothetical protein QW318_07110, partial [Candidatus Caldarchaeum sp.]
MTSRRTRIIYPPAGEGFSLDDRLARISLSEFVLNEGMSEGDVVADIEKIPASWWPVELIGESVTSGQLTLEPGSTTIRVGPAGAGLEGEPYSDLSLRVARRANYNPVVALSVSNTSIVPGESFQISISLVGAPEW